MTKEIHQRAVDIFKHYCKKEYSALQFVNHRVEQLDDFLYSIEYSDWDYNAGKAYLSKYRPDFGGCTTVVVGDYFMRNFDWYYNNSVEFVVKTHSIRGRHASIGIAQGHPQLTKDFVESMEWSDAYEVLPFIMTDGCNDAGVRCSINVVPSGDKGITTGSNPESENSMCVYMIPRYILDYADSAKDAINLLERINWWAPTGSDDAFESHFMISDATDTYAVEFVNNGMVVFSSDETDEYNNFPCDGLKAITNFYLDGFDGDLVTGFNTQGGITWEDTTLTPHAMGVERYAILKDLWEKFNVNDATEDDFLVAMTSVLRYSNAYSEDTDPFWYSELTGLGPFGNLTIYDNAEKFDAIKEVAISIFSDKQRDNKVWHTMHTSYYYPDPDNNTIFPKFLMNVYIQERDEGFIFEVPTKNKAGLF